MVSDPNISHFKVRVKINTKMVMVRPSVLFKVRSKADFLAARPFPTILDGHQWWAIPIFRDTHGPWMGDLGWEYSNLSRRN